MMRYTQDSPPQFVNLPNYHSKVGFLFFKTVLIPLKSGSTDEAHLEDQRYIYCSYCKIYIHIIYIAQLTT